jgi:hypothetical protein
VLKVQGVSVGAPLHLLLVDLAAAKDTVAILAALQAGGGGPLAAMSQGRAGRVCRRRRF